MRLSDLRQRVSIEEVLRSRGLLDGLRRRGHRLVGPCPVHGGDNPSAFVVDLRRDLWNCFTRCPGGDVVDLVRCLDGTDHGGAARVLRGLAGAPRPAPPPPEPFRPYTRRLTLDVGHPFLASRGIHPGTARLFEVGAWHGRGMLADCVAVRLHDPQGLPLGYAGRRLHPDPRGKWVVPPRMPRSRLLYGWHRLEGEQPLVVVEGPWEVLRLHQLGVPAVALLGLHASEHQLQLLRQRRCAVLLDGDPPGRQAAQVLARWLAAQVVTPPDGLDPADLDDDRLERLLRPLLSQPARLLAPGQAPTPAPATAIVGGDRPR